ncbi:MAG TPA: YCF48-related protein [Candidatus Acidoferrales bacterium]
MASLRPDKTGAEMLRQSLAHQPAAAGECPEPEILAAYFERSLNAEETARCELHLSGCARCRAELALIERAGRDVAAGEERRQGAGSRAWIWDWRWLAPVAAALVIAAVWIVQRPSNSNRESQSQTLVAMSRPSEPPTKEAPTPSRTPAQGAPSAAAPKSEIAQSRALNKMQNSVSREMNQPSTNEKLRQVTPLDVRRDVDSTLRAKTAGAPQIDSEERAARKETESKALADALQTAPASPAANAPPVQAGNAGGMLQAETDESPQSLKSKQQMAAPAKPNLYAQKDAKAATVSGGIGAVARVVRTPDPKVLWQISEQGVLKSEDGGGTWQQANLPVANAHIVSVAAPSAQVCWLVGRDSLILLTTDGTHWQTVAPPARADFVQVAAENAFSATVTTAEGLRFQTGDAGQHWHPLP